MSFYNKSTNFAVKDSLTTGDPNKIVSGVEIDTEFTNIASAFSSVNAALDFSASDIDYSNTSSGFTATDMQAAFDEVTDNPYVVQTITADTGTTVSLSTGTFTNIGLLASITPKFASSKILIMASISMNQRRDNDSVLANVRLLKDGSSVMSVRNQDDRSTGDLRSFEFPIPFYYDEVVSSTDEITFSFQGNCGKTTNSGRVDFNTSRSTLVIMEIKQ